MIATPPSATAGLVRAALEAGKWVLAEKPLALSVAETAEVVTQPGLPSGSRSGSRTATTPPSTGCGS